MTVLAPKFPKLLPDLIRRLATDSDAECILVARAIGRALRSNGQDLHDLADHVGRGGDDHRHDDHRAAGGHYGDPWQCTVQWCLGHGARLTSKENDFLVGMAGWHGEPSAKQMQWISRIADKLRRAS
jgi:hypothetical protein